MIWEELICDMEKQHYTFGRAFREIREKQGISIREIARKAGKTPPYIWDIEKGNNKPPGKHLLKDLLIALDLHDERSVSDFLFDLAANERGGFPEDIAEYVMNNETLRILIRSVQGNEKDEQIWQECLKLADRKVGAKG